MVDLRGGVVRRALQRRRIRRLGVTRDLDRVLDQQPAALVPGNRSLDEDQAALDVGRDDLEVLLRALAVAHVARHLLVLEHLARILALTGRAERAVRDRDAVRRAQAAEIPALHAALEALTDRVAGDVDELARDEVVGRQRRAGVEQRIFGHAELGNMGLGLDLGGGEVAALGLGRVLGLLGAGAKLDGDIAVALARPLRHDLAVLEAQHRYRDVATIVLEQAGHPHFLRDHATAHDQFLSLRGPRGGMTS